MKMLFNRNPLQYGKTIEQPTNDEIKNTPALRGASLDDAMKYGGDLTKVAISALNLKFDRKYMLVDTKIHMLMPGFSPAISGWHTDGVPRGEELNPSAKKPPNIQAQEEMSDTRYHLLVTGEGCLTKFIDRQLELEVPDKPSTDLYKMVSRQVNDYINDGHLDESVITVPSCTAVEFDWWDIHTAVPATKHEWRFLIRVTESDYKKPQTDLRQIIRTQQQVYLPHNFGW